MKATKAQIEDFLAQPHIALAGYSTNPKKFGAMVYKTLKEKGYKIYPVNPAGGTTTDGETIYKNLAELPIEVKAVLVITKPVIAEGVVKEAASKGFTHLWVQQMSETPEVLLMADGFKTAVTKECIMMFAQPSGFHKFHWWLAKLIGKVPA